MIKKYDEYRKVDAFGIKELPSHWNIKRGFSYFYENTEKNTNADEKLQFQFKYGTIVPKKDQDDIDKDVEKYKKYTVIQPNDIAINGLNLNYDFVSQRIAAVKDRGIITSAYLILRPRRMREQKYLVYLLKGYDGIKLFHGIGSGLRQTLTSDEVLKLQLPVPPKEEQEQIVRYLDWKTSEIDRMRRGLKHQIKDLKELRLSLIDRAVTKGIDDAELKESGYSWIGMIPKHWNMEYSKHFFSLRKEKAYIEDEQLTSSQQYGIISQQEYMEREGRRLTVVLTGDDILKHVSVGDFVISMRSFQGGIEYSKVSGKISSAYVMLIPDHKYVNDEYYKWLFKSPSYIKALQGTSDLVRDGQALRYSNFAKVYLPGVPLDEQKRIADYLDKKTPIIDETIERLRKEIDLLEELRTKIIADVVTGQMDVRDVVVPEYSRDEDTDSDDIEDDEEIEESED
ncbi:MAG: restriction endonuclease subunit S [Lachnospiraceae bacterium]|jgi:type I restriction enzyme S subunit|nr:restriction endonuclease subunit S [Lachnospiraceae bacterium]